MGRGRELDWTSLLAALALAGIGVSTLVGAHGLEGGLAARQLLWIGIGLVALAVALAVDYRAWSGAAWGLYAVNLGVLAAVLALGRRINGSKSWLALGAFNFQPSECMKIATILVIARLAAAHRRDDASPGLLLRLGLAVAAPLALILLQPDLGTALTFVAVLGAALAVVGLSRRTWALLVVAIAATAASGWTWLLRDYQKERIRTFLDPGLDARDTGYQIIQSRIAIGSGGLAGKGWSAGTQSQLNFIPEKHTDFVFPVVAEEWGFLGTLVVLGLYVFLVSRGLETALQARDARGSYLVLGIMALVAAHALINLGMVMGLLPTIGIPLPLMSYGGSSVVSTLAGLGLCLNVRMRRIANA